MTTVTAETFGTFEFGLTEEQEERARRLHAESLVCDMLFQGPCGYRSFSPAMTAEVEEEYKTHRSDLQYVFSAVSKTTKFALRGECPDFNLCWDESGLAGANRQAPVSFNEKAAPLWGTTTAQFDHFPWLIKALTAEDIRRAKREGKQAGYVTNQNLGEIGGNIDLLDSLHAVGMRMIQLTYNQMNGIGAGCTERTDAGVSH